MKTEPAKPKAVKLPSYMLIDARSGEWSFHQKPQSEDSLEFLYGLLTESNGHKCDDVETVPTKDPLSQEDYFLYGDGLGMMKRLAMNVAYNPLCESQQITFQAGCGGPYGSLVLQKEKGTISAKLLRRLVKEYIKENGGEREEDFSTREGKQYSEALEKAIKGWTSEHR